jgi:hypothetical protein
MIENKSVRLRVEQQLISGIPKRLGDDDSVILFGKRYRVADLVTLLQRRVSATDNVRAAKAAYEQALMLEREELAATGASSESCVTCSSSCSPHRRTPSSISASRRPFVVQRRSWRRPAPSPRRSRHVRHVTRWVLGSAKASTASRRPPRAPAPIQGQDVRKRVRIRPPTVPRRALTPP